MTGLAGVHRGARRRPRQGRAEPARQARAGHVPRGGQTARRAAGAGRGLRGRAGRRRRRARRELRPRGRRRPRRPARGAARARRGRRRRRPLRAPLSFDVEPWSVTEDGLDLESLARSESVFALSNGHIGLRGNLDEGEPFGLPGTYLNGFYETRPLPYAEAGYGYPEDGQTVVNATNGKLIRLLVDDEPFDIRYGELLKHVRTLDLRAGQLRRDGPLALAERARGRGQDHADRLLHAALGGGDPLRGAPARRQGGACRRAVRARGQRARPRPERGSTRRLGAARAADGRAAGGARPARRARAPHQAERAADGRGDRPRDRGRRTA